MVKAIERAMTAAKQAVESRYDGVCSVYTYGESKDPTTHITRTAETVLYQDIPCRLSFKYNNNSSASPSETITEVSQIIKLFVSPELNIPPGSKIVATQNGVTTAYKSSGQPMVYSTHQEIVLEIFRGWT